MRSVFQVRQCQQTLDSEEEEQTAGKEEEHQDKVVQGECEGRKAV